MLRSAFAIKKIAILVLVASSFLTLPATIKAEEGSSTPRPFIQKLQNVKQELKEKSATREGERKERMDDLRKAIVSNFFNSMLQRLQAAHDRLAKILTRIETSVAKIKAENPSNDLTNLDAQI